jgi:short-subunit dehydrogenase
MPHPAEVVVITGASAGVGRATAVAFARQGAHLVLIARGRDRLEQARREVEEAGGRAIVAVADVADAEQLEAAAVQAEKAFGPIDIWINNAMTSVFAPVMQITPDEFRRVMEVTFLGYVHGTQAALRRMLPRNAGSIVQVGSALAYRGIPLQAPYCAAKHAIQGFCDSLWSELIHQRSGVRMTMVQMPALNTPQFDWVRSKLLHRAQPVPPIYQPEIAADAIVWAAHHGGREVWVGAPVVKAIIGDRLAPGLLDRVLASRGFDAQQTSEPEDPERPDNLWNPVPGDYAAHGRFDREARSTSIQFRLARNKRVVAGATIGIAIAAAAAWRRSSRDQSYTSRRDVKELKGEGGGQPTLSRIDNATVETVLESWGDIPQKAARRTINRYGLPNEATPSRLIWFDNGPWKRTIVYRDEVPHNFPKPHTDVLEQFVDYRVPVERVSDLARYDGSVIVERTKGEVSARCDMEEMNFLALNLMHEIATSNRTVDDARRTYAETATAFMMGKESPYTDGLQFESRRDDTPYVDEVTMTPMMKSAAEQATDAVRGRERS